MVEGNTSSGVTPSRKELVEKGYRVGRSRKDQECGTASNGEVEGSSQGLSCLVLVPWVRDLDGAHQQWNFQLGRPALARSQRLGNGVDEEHAPAGKSS